MRRDRSGVAAFSQVNLLWNGGSHLMSGIAVALPEADRPLSPDCVEKVEVRCGQARGLKQS